MQDEKKDVVIDTQNDTVIPPQGETDAQKAERLEATNKKLYERVKIAEPLAKEYKKLKENPISTPEKPKVEDEIVGKVNRLEQIETKRQFGYKNNLSPEETDLLFRFAGDKDPSDALKDDDFKDLLDVRRKRTKVANAIPSSSNRAPSSVGGKDWSSLTPEEKAEYRKNNWDKIVTPK